MGYDTRPPMNNLVIEIDKFNQTFYIKHGCGAYVNGHTSWGGEIFFVFVPPQYRRKGIAKLLLKRAFELLRDDFSCVTPGITSPTSKEGTKLIEWFKREYNQ